MLRNLQWRLIWIFIFITLFISVIIWFVLNRSVESSYYNIFEKSMESRYKNWDMKDNPTADEIKTDLSVNRNAIMTFLTSDTLTITVIDKKNNEIVYSSDERAKTRADSGMFLYDILKSKNLRQVMLGSESGDSNIRAVTGEDGSVFFDYARAKGDFILYFRYYQEEWGQIIKNFNNIILFSCIFAIMLSLVVGYFLSNTITVPIKNIMKKAQELAAGNFDRKLEVKTNDEIGELTGTFNFMAEELKNTLGEISMEKNKIETILNYMTDGIIAFNLKGEVVHINPASKDMLGISEFDDTFDRFAGRYGLGLTLDEILAVGSESKLERSIEIDGKYIRVYFVLFTDEEKKAEGIIAVLQDITQQQKLENMRKEFVANVSHELRTPLTSIKSYAETLLDGVLEERDTAERFIGVINSEADRMTRLVKDLLQLSKFDDRKMQLKMGEVSVGDLVSGAVEKMKKEAANKDLTVDCFIAGGMPEISADYDRIEQVVLNILSNSIKYTPKGGKVTVSAGIDRARGEVYIKVGDTGIGIPKDDLTRVFDRFYRVDKARSRELGGTGLGLSIAKEIVDAHNGTIEITSEIDRGTEITVRLPITHSSIAQ